MARTRAARQLTIAGAYLFGRLLNLVVKGRPSRFARSSRPVGRHPDRRTHLAHPAVERAGRRVDLGELLAAARALARRRPRGDLGGGLGVGDLRGGGRRHARSSPSYGQRATPGVPVSGLTRNIVRLVIVALGVLVMLNELGVEIRPMLAALGVGGLAVALAAGAALEPVRGPLHLDGRQVRIGDRVRLDSGRRRPHRGLQLALDVARGRLGQRRRDPERQAVAGDRHQLQPPHPGGRGAGGVRRGYVQRCRGGGTHRDGRRARGHHHHRGGRPHLQPAGAVRRDERSRAADDGGAAGQNVRRRRRGEARVHPRGARGCAKRR